MAMKKLLAKVVVPMALMAACSPGGVMGPGGGGDDDDAPPPVAPDAGTGVTSVGGTIAADTTWSGDLAVASTTVNAGVTLTIAAGTQLHMASGAGIIVKGTLKVTGTDAQKVAFSPSAADWSGVSVSAGGKLDLAHASLTKAGTAIECGSGALGCAIDHATITGNLTSMHLAAPTTITRSLVEKSSGNSINLGVGADVTITDTDMKTAGGDIIVQSGGKLKVDYSTIGEVIDSYEHCGIHINSAETLIIEHTEIHSNVYGAMIGGTNGARINFSNWRDNSTDISAIGTNTALNLTKNYWSGTPPSALGDTSQAEAAPLAVGPRP
jgi:hypothetical protein